VMALAVFGLLLLVVVAPSCRQAGPVRAAIVGR
jgi:hypothetical protein